MKIDRVTRDNNALLIIYEVLVAIAVTIVWLLSKGNSVNFIYNQF